MERLLDRFATLSFINIIDIMIVAFVAYKLIMLVKGTRAVQLMKGIAVLLLASFVSEWFGLYTINWILIQAKTVLLVALPVVFQPELRRALERIGRGQIFAKSPSMLGEEELKKLIREIARACQILSKNRYGALIIFERKTGIKDYIETGIKIDGLVSTEFLVNIFVPKTPLHDGAVIIHGDRVVAAGCFLPLSENPYLSKELGTRHRAALGITEQSDALALVVSEETGTISVAEDGIITRYFNEETLIELLEKRFLPKSHHPFSFKGWRS